MFVFVAGSVKGGVATPSARTMVSHTTVTTHHRHEANTSGITPLPPPLVRKKVQFVKLVYVYALKLRCSSISHFL